MTTDYTAGEPLPEAILFGQDAVVDQDVAEVEASNVSGTLAPGSYLLRVAGFGKAPKKDLKTAYINGKAGTYEAYTISVRFNDAANTGSVWATLVLPPNGGPANLLYQHGSNASGKGTGFMAGVFYQFIDKIFPGKVEKGKPLPKVATDLNNWIGKQAWAIVELDSGGYVKSGIDPATDEPYAPSEPKARIKFHSFRMYVPGQPSPYAGQRQPTKAAAKAASMASNLVGAGAATNGYHAPAEEDNGVSDI